MYSALVVSLNKHTQTHTYTLLLYEYASQVMSMLPKILYVRDNSRQGHQLDGNNDEVEAKDELGELPLPSHYFRTGHLEGFYPLISRLCLG